MQVQYQEKKKLKQEIEALSTQLRIALPTLVYATLLHWINVSVKSKIKLIAKHHERKLSKFRKHHQQKSDIKRPIEVSKNARHTFLSYTPDDEIMALEVNMSVYIA